jgi:hypothetical protein
MEDAAEILGGTVTGQAKGKSITLPMVQAMFRTLCRRALKGDNRALRRVIELMLTLEPAARKAKKEDTATREAARKFVRLAGADPDKIDEARKERKEPDPKMKELNMRVDAMVREERRRLRREARRSQGQGPMRQYRLDFGAQRSIAMGVRQGASPSIICRQARPRPGSPRCKACGPPRGRTRR